MALQQAQRVVHLTRFGHGGEADSGAEWQWLPWVRWAAQGALVADAVYAQRAATAFEALALAQGVRVLSGAGRAMLAAQAAEAFGHWTGTTPDWQAALAELNR